MARHDDDNRYRNGSSRDDRGSNRDPLSGSRAGRRSHDDGEDDRSRPYGRGEERRYGGYEGERGDVYRHAEPAGRRRSEYGYGGGSSYGRSNYEQDDMSSGGVAGGARGYGHAYGPGHGGEMYQSRGGSLGGGFGIAASGQEHHRGKGPKGYTRSDDRIREDVCDCLTDDPMLDAGEIEVQVKDGEVTLTGSVSDRLAKRHAEDMIERVSGVRNVQNSIRVRNRDTTRQSPDQLAQAGGALDGTVERDR